MADDIEDPTEDNKDTTVEQETGRENLQPQNGMWETVDAEDKPSLEQLNAWATSSDPIALDKLQEWAERMDVPWDDKISREHMADKIWDAMDAHPELTER